MITTKEIYFTVEDVFDNIKALEYPLNAYPNVPYGLIGDWLFYKPKYNELLSPSWNQGRSIMPQVTEEDEQTLLNNVLKFIQLYLAEYSCFKIDCQPHENISIAEVLPSYYDYGTGENYNERFRESSNNFVERFASWIKESIEVWIPKFKIYENFDYSEFLTNPDKVITKEDISTPRVARSRSQVKKINDTPEEVGDFTGDGYVNQIEFVNNTDNAPTGTDEFSSTVNEHDVEKTLRILNECLLQVRNLYRQWMIDFRRKVLID